MKIVGKFDFKLLEWAEVKVIFTLGMDVFVAALFSVVMGHSLLLFSGHLLTLEQTAILAVNLKLVNMMTQILHRIPGSAEPMLMKMVSDKKDEQFRVWWQLITKMTILSALFCAGMFVFWNKLVVSTWTSDEMVMQGAALVLLALIPFRFLVHYVFVNSLAIFKEIRKVKWFLLWEVVLYSGLAFMLGQEFGLVGLLSANLLSMLGGALLRGMKCFAFYSAIPFRKLLMLFIRLTLPLVSAFYVLFVFANRFENLEILYSIRMSICWSLLCVVICYFFVFDSSDRLHLNSLVLKIKNG